MCNLSRLFNTFSTHSVALSLSQSLSLSFCLSPCVLLCAFYLSNVIGLLVKIVMPAYSLLQFPAMRALSISSADAFILVYDVTDASTFEEVRAIRDQIHETKATTAVPIVVVGNKVDLLAEDGELREVSRRARVNTNNNDHCH